MLSKEDLTKDNLIKWGIVAVVVAAVGHLAIDKVVIPLLQIVSGILPKIG